MLYYRSFFVFISFHIDSHLTCLHHDWYDVLGEVSCLHGFGIKDSGNSSSRFFVSELHLFRNFVIFNDIDFRFSTVVDNNITFDVQQ